MEIIKSITEKTKLVADRVWYIWCRVWYAWGRLTFGRPILGFIFCVGMVWAVGDAGGWS